MPKYHINRAGLPAECRASKKPCPIGGEHYESKLDALAAADEMAREDGFFLQSAKKSVVFHVGGGGAVEECAFRDGYCEVKPYGRFSNVHSHQREVIEGAAGVLREQVGGETGPLPVTKHSVKPEPSVKNVPVAQPDESSNQARPGLVLRGDGRDHFRYAGWSEAEINEYQDTCGHSYPAGRIHVPMDCRGPAIPEGQPGNMVESARREKARREAEAAARTAQARRTYPASTC